MNTLFFELIRVAIGTQESLTKLPSESEWEKLFDIAVKQALVGISFIGLHRLGADADDGFVRIGMSEDLYLGWMGMATQISMKNEHVNRQCVELQQTIKKAGFCSFIMKGQGNAVLYKSFDDLSLFRQSGDIDIYLDGGFKKVNAFVQRTCPTKEINELEIHYHCFDDTEVEIHYRPFFMRNPRKNARLQRFFNETMVFNHKVSLPNGAGHINVPTSEFNLVHQMIHIYHHLVTEGVGMRHIMDYYFVLLDAWTNGLNYSKVQRAIYDLGLDRFASALMWVLGYVFGLQSDVMPWKPCLADGGMLLEEIQRSGNFGHYDETAVNLRNKWTSFWYVNNKVFRFWRFDHWAWFWSPLWRVYHFAWRKFNGYK